MSLAGLGDGQRQVRLGQLDYKASSQLSKQAKKIVPTAHHSKVFPSFMLKGLGIS